MLNFETTTINGNEYNFIGSQTIENLPPNSYSFCIKISGYDTYEQCFEVIIDEGSTISGKTSISSNKASVEISNGSAPFEVYLNNVLQFTTNQSLFDIDVKHGDELKVKSSVDCEGAKACAFLLKSFH